MARRGKQAKHMAALRERRASNRKYLQTVNETASQQQNYSPGSCVICSGSADINTNQKFNNRPLVKFILEQIIVHSQQNVPEEQDVDIDIAVDGLKFCCSCQVLLTEGLQLRHQIVELESEMEQLMVKVKRLVVDSSLNFVKIEHDDHDGDNDNKDSIIYERIRQQLMSSFNSSSKEEHKWYGIEFDGVGDHDEERSEDFDVDPLSLASDPLDIDTNEQLVEAVEAVQVVKRGEDNDNIQLGVANNFKDSNTDQDEILNTFFDYTVNFLHQNQGRIVKTYSKNIPKRQVSPIKNLSEEQLTIKKKKEQTLLKRKLKGDMLQAQGKRNFMDKKIVSTTSKSPPVQSSSSLKTTPKTEIFETRFGEVMNAGWIKTAKCANYTLPEVRKLPHMPLIKKNIPCVICSEVFESTTEASLHRKYIHPGLAVCVGPVYNLQCGKIFKSCDIKRHRKESHPLLKCPSPGCLHSFSSRERLESHVNELHDPAPEVQDCGYDVKLIPWVTPLTREEVMEATGGRGALFVDVVRMQAKIKTESDETLQKIGGDKAIESSSEPQSTDSQTEEPIVHERLELENTVIVNLNQKSVTNSTEEIVDIGSGIDLLPSIPCSQETAPRQKFDKPLKSVENDTSETAVIGKPAKRRKILYNCGVCNTKFNTQPNLLQHLVDAHNKKTQFGCFVCHKKFESLTDCEAHVFTEHPQASSTKGKEHSPIGNFSSTDTNLSRNPEKKKSTTCQGKITSERERIWPFVCQLCLMRFSTLNVLQGHLMSEDHLLTVEHGRLEKCPQKWCTYSYRGEKDLTSHIALAHKVGDVPAPPKQYKCPDCSLHLKEEDALTRHRIRRHGFTPLIPLPPVVIPCPACEKTFTKKQIPAHMMKVHGVSKLKCPRCGKGFLNAGRMRDHIKFVHDKTPGNFVCDVCGKHFINRYKLNYHRAIHGEERPFLCSECGKTFKTKTSLTIHNYSHDPDRWTKHYPYRILVEKRKITQQKREGMPATAKRGRKPLSSTATVALPPVQLVPVVHFPIHSSQQQDCPAPGNFVILRDLL